MKMCVSGLCVIHDHHWSRLQGETRSVPAWRAGCSWTPGSSLHPNQTVWAPSGPCCRFGPRDLPASLGLRRYSGRCGVRPPGSVDRLPASWSRFSGTEASPPAATCTASFPFPSLRFALLSLYAERNKPGQSGIIRLIRNTCVRIPRTCAVLCCCCNLQPMTGLHIKAVSHIKAAREENMTTSTI